MFYILPDPWLFTAQLGPYAVYGMSRPQWEITLCKVLFQHFHNV